MSIQKHFYILPIVVFGFLYYILSSIKFENDFLNLIKFIVENLILVIYFLYSYQRLKNRIYLIAYSIMLLGFNLRLIAFNILNLEVSRNISFVALMITIVMLVLLIVHWLNKSVYLNKTINYSLNTILKQSFIFTLMFQWIVWSIIL
jgi:hypothetical protein